jgi:hypothetical protein
MDWTGEAGSWLVKKMCRLLRVAWIFLLPVPFIDSVTHGPITMSLWWGRHPWCRPDKTTPWSGSTHRSIVGSRRLMRVPSWEVDVGAEACWVGGDVRLDKKRLVHSGDKCCLGGRDRPHPWSGDDDRMRMTTTNPWRGDDDVWLGNKSWTGGRLEVKRI